MRELLPRNLEFETLEFLGLIVSYQSAVNPADREWNAWLDGASALVEKTNELRTLVMTEGGHPSQSQVRRLEAVKQRYDRVRRRRSEPRTAIVSFSPKLRFVTSVLTFANPAIRCFTPAEMGAAYAHIGLTPEQGKYVDAVVERLRERVVACWMGA